jgi:hypothetical protein
VDMYRTIALQAPVHVAGPVYCFAGRAGLYVVVALGDFAVDGLNLVWRNSLVHG